MSRMMFVAVFVFIATLFIFLIQLVILIFVDLPIIAIITYTNRFICEEFTHRIINKDCTVILKYHNDLYETIETFNKYCLNNDAELVNDLDVKDTYMWNMANYLYNFETINEFFLKKDNESNRALYDENAIDFNRKQ